MGSGSGKQKRTNIKATMAPMTTSWPEKDVAEFINATKDTNLFFGIDDEKIPYLNSSVHTPITYYLSDSPDHFNTSLEELEYALSELFKDCVAKNALSVFGSNIANHSNGMFQNIISSLDENQIKININYVSKDSAGIEFTYDGKFISQSFYRQDVYADPHLSIEQALNQEIALNSIDIIRSLLETSFI